MAASKYNLTRAQRESVFLLSIGTFLEYFDLMLYIHMAVVLNDLFFPQADPLTAKLLAAFAFCSTYFLRPIGGFVIGWIGDRVGRKSTIMITTTIMAASCAIIANLPTYSEIGIAATIVLLLCRILQGFSSLGEIVGAELYLSETLKQPHRYLCNSLIDVSWRAGGAGALLVAMLALSINLNWRVAFWIGAAIAFFGFFARARLRETPEFVDFKRRMAIRAENDGHIVDDISSYKQKVNGKALATYFIMHGTRVAGFYMTYIYIGSFMRETLGFTYEQVMYQNLRITIAEIIFALIARRFLIKYHPVKMARVGILLFSPFLLCVPYLLNNISGLISLSFVQIMFGFFGVCSFGMETACFSHLPIPRRFTLLAATYGLASATAYTVMSFGLIPLTNYFGYYGLLIIHVPLILAFLCGVNYVKKLETKRGMYLNYPDSDDESQDSGVNNYDFENSEAYKAYDTNCDYASALLNKLSYKLVDLRLVEKAIIFAKKWHSGQKRNTGEPYYTHPCTVASRVSEYTSNTNVIVAAILHDVVEDSSCNVELIAKEFNSRIAQIVQRLTRLAFYNSHVIYDENHNKIKLSIKEICKNLLEAEDAEALITKQLDRLHNLETSDGLKKNKQKKFAQETIKFLLPYVALAVDRFNINDKLGLEEKIYACCRKILVNSK